MSPDQQTNLHTLMTAAADAIEAGDFGQAHRLCKQVLQDEPRQPQAWYYMSIIALSMKRARDAIRLVDKALLLCPERADYLVHKAKCHSLLHQADQAREAADKAFSSKTLPAHLLETLGVVYKGLGEYEAAREVYNIAVQLEPDQQQFWFGLGSTQQFMGNFEEARRAYERVIELQPDHAQAYWVLSGLDKNESNPVHIEKLKSLLLEENLTIESELMLSHALFCEYEKLGDFTSAFEALKQSKQRRRESVRYDPEVDKQMFEALLQIFEKPDSVSPSSVKQGGEAIFIVGMPRTGTTLVERILSSHSQIGSLGELDEFMRAVKYESGSDTPYVFDKEVILTAATVDMTRVGQRYLEMVAGRRQHHRKFVDKMPMNFACVGFILQALPDARVICLRRHPLDTILSNYRQLFSMNFSFYNYNYDLEDTAQYFVQFDQLMQRWRDLFGERFFEISYEALIDDPEQQVREMLDYTAVNFEPGCLEFHKNTAAVATASNVQVREPLYSSAVGRWQQYRPQLEPAMTVLREAGIAY